MEKDGRNINMIVCSTCHEFSKLTEKPSETEMKNNPFLYGSSSYRKTSHMGIKNVAWLSDKMASEFHLGQPVFRFDLP